ncbi:MAG: putative DNA binding domain-containing protein [Bacteroidales bacterium]|nr:putative DNA binding domain-containing protein [Bacteroidales bacterium]
MKTDGADYIKDLLQKKESATLEFKARFDKIEIGKVICSFLNRDGGQLVLGAGESQKVTGIKDAEKTASAIQNFLIDEIVPEPAVSVDVQTVGKKNLLVVSVWKGTNQPYIFKGGVYYRTGSSTVQADSKQLAALIHVETDRNQRWETKSAIEVEVEDIDLNEVLECIKEANLAGRDQNLPENPLQFMSKYGLYKNGDFTNAAVVLFGKNPVKFFPQMRVRLSVFKTDKTGERLLYDKIFDGNLFKSIQQITEFFDLAYGITSSFRSADWQRTDKLNFPRLAIREAILNAFIHRDYSSFSSKIAINVYPDKLQISSYGSLPKGISIKSLSEDHLSVPVNPTIAHIFFLRNWIELIGIGTVKMIAQCKELGFKEPVWNQRDNTVNVLFPDVKVPFNYSEGISEGITEGLNNLIVKAINEGISEGITEGLKDIYLNVIEALIKKGSLNVTQLSNELGKSTKTVERYVAFLKEIGAIGYEGSKKAGGYQVSDHLLKMNKE